MGRLLLVVTAPVAAWGTIVAVAGGDTAAADSVGILIMLSAGVLTVWGTFTFTDKNRGPWLLVAGAVIGLAFAWLLRGLLMEAGHTEVVLYPPSPTPPTGWLLGPDLITGAAYAQIAVAMMWFGRLRSPRTTLTSTLDVVIVVAAMSLFAWILTVEPVLRSDVAIHIEVQSVAYTAFDMILLFVLARHVFGTAELQPPERYLLYGLASLIVGDLIMQFFYAAHALDWDVQSQPLTALYPFAPVFAALAATHPMMRITGEPRPAQSRSSVQIAAITMGMFTPPALLAISGPDGTGGMSKVVLAAVCATFSVLLVWRYRSTLSGLWRAEHRAARAETQERRRIAQQLHDGAIQDLLAVRFGLAALEPVDAGPLRDGVDTTLRSVRSAVAALRDSLDGNDTFAEVIAVDLDRLTGLGMDVSFTQSFTEESSPRSASLAYRNTREALRNVARHAEASRVDVAVTSGDGWLSVAVTDDGRGFDRAEAARRAKAGHIGVVSMSETVAEVGGEFRVVSPVGPDGGTTVSFKIPSQLATGGHGTDHHLDLPARTWPERVGV